MSFTRSNGCLRAQTVVRAFDRVRVEKEVYFGFRTFLFLPDATQFASRRRPRAPVCADGATRLL